VDQALILVGPNKKWQLCVMYYRRTRREKFYPTG